jgi:hypothetical protein
MGFAVNPLVLDPLICENKKGRYPLPRRDPFTEVTI